MDYLDLRDRMYRRYRSERSLNSLPVDVGSIGDTLRIIDLRYSKYLPTDRSARILEIGCGDGTFLLYLLSKGFNLVEGVDSSPEQIAVAKRRGLRQVTLADNYERLKQINGQIDIVIALDVIEHYNKLELLMLLDAVYGALKDTGVLLVQTPNADGPFGARHRYGDFTHELAFTPTSLSQALRMAGFKEIEFTPVEPIIHGAVSFMRWCAWKAIRLLLVAYLAVETGCLRGHVLTQNMIALARK